MDAQWTVKGSEHVWQDTCQKLGVLRLSWPSVPARFGALFKQQCLGATLGPSLDGADLAFVNARRPDHQFSLSPSRENHEVLVFS